MRTFIGVNISNEIKMELSRIQNVLKEMNLDVKWVKPENMHITLKFLGEIQKEKIKILQNDLTSVANRFKPFEINISGLGTFPDLRRPRVIWIGIDRGGSELKKMAIFIENNLANIGLAKEDKKFSAHLTLGRVRTTRNIERLKDKVEKLDIRPLSCVVDRFILFRSTLTQQGPIYTSIFEWSFSGF